MIMHAPRTFTGEDTVEIDCHGGVYAMQRFGYSAEKMVPKLRNQENLPNVPS